MQYSPSEPGRLAQFAYDAIQMTVHRDGANWVCNAPGRPLVYSPRQPQTLLSAGYAVDDPAILEGRPNAH